MLNICRLLNNVRKNKFHFTERVNVAYGELSEQSQVTFLSSILKMNIYFFHIAIIARMNID